MRSTTYHATPHMIEQRIVGRDDNPTFCRHEMPVSKHNILRINNIRRDTTRSSQYDARARLGSFFSFSRRVGDQQRETRNKKRETAAPVTIVTMFRTTLLATILSAATFAAEVTFTKDVAPILQRACQDCHRPGAIAPMPLLTYQDARPWARSIKQKVVRREMPPWYIDPNVGITRFKGDPSLTDAEIAIISNWVDRGAPAGDPADMPPPRQFSDVNKWHIGKPDLIVSMPKPYKLKANGPDEFYDIDVDPGFTEDLYIAAVGTHHGPEAFKAVHHVNASPIQDEEDDPVGLFLNEYALGKNGDIFPANSARLISAGSKIHFNLHLHPYGKENSVSAS